MSTYTDPACRFYVVSLTRRQGGTLRFQVIDKRTGEPVSRWRTLDEARTDEAQRNGAARSDWTGVSAPHD